MKMKGLLLLVICLLLGLTACGGSQSAPENTDKKDPDAGASGAAASTGVSESSADDVLSGNLPAELSEDLLLKTSIAVLSGPGKPDDKGVPRNKKLQAFRNTDRACVYAPPGIEPSCCAVLISANDGTVIEVLPVTGWNEDDNSFITENPIYNGVFDRGEFLTVGYYETESLPLLLARITASDGHTQSLFTFDYDGSGEHTRDGITSRTVLYGFAEDGDEILEKEARIIKYLSELAKARAK